MASGPPSSARNTAETPQPLAVIVQQVKGWVERCGWVWVEAQVIEINRRAAPTQFLVMRDKNAEQSVRVTCTAMVLDAAGPLTQGTTVVACITPRVWAKDASLSFECAELRIVGEGRLLAQLEQLKRKLQAEGLFDPARKRRLPFLPRAIGVITGAGSAAERDVLTNIARRWPAADVRVRHSLVQGPDAAREVMTALSQLDADPGVEVIVIARGGGSLEDLLPFSDEGLVRAVFAARTPVVSAIGHEPDSPILDLVADARASTPTHAARLVVPDAAEQAQQVRDALARLRQAIVTRLRSEQQSLDGMRSRPVLRDPTGGFASHDEWLRNRRDRLARAIDRRLADDQTVLDHALRSIRTMSPKATLERGYAIVADADGSSVTSVSDVEAGDQLMVYLSDGQIFVEVDQQEAEAT